MEFESYHSDSNQRERRPELSSIRPNLHAILGRYAWIYGNVGADGHLTLRLRSSSSLDENPHITGEITWADGGCGARGNITRLMARVDAEGKEYWAVDVDAWILGQGLGDDVIPSATGHQLASTVAVDDNGNPYLVLTLLDEIRDGTGVYSCYMIGKKQGGPLLSQGDIRRLGLRVEP